MQQFCFFLKRKAKLTGVGRVSVCYLCRRHYTCTTPGWQSELMWTLYLLYGLACTVWPQKNQCGLAPTWFSESKPALTFTRSEFGRRVREAAIDSEMLTDLHLGPWSCCGMINSFCSSLGLPAEEVASPPADRIRSCENWLKERRSDELLFLIGDVGLLSLLRLAVLSFD